MNIHPPKRITSSGGLGLNTQKSITWLSPTHAITTEIWPKLEAPWHESGTVIADENYVWKIEWKVGERFVKTKIYDARNDFVASYTDICRPVTLVNGVFAFEDMYLDVWQPAGERPTLLDEDELELAVEQGIVSENEAAEILEAARQLIL